MVNLYGRFGTTVRPLIIIIIIIISDSGSTRVKGQNDYCENYRCVYHKVSIALCGAENWTIRMIDQKYLESFEICCAG